MKITTRQRSLSILVDSYSLPLRTASIRTFFSQHWFWLSAPLFFRITFVRAYYTFVGAHLYIRSSIFDSSNMFLCNVTIHKLRNTLCIYSFWFYNILLIKVPKTVSYRIFTWLKWFIILQEINEWWWSHFLLLISSSSHFKNILRPLNDVISRQLVWNLIL